MDCLSLRISVLVALGLSVTPLAWAESSFMEYAQGRFSKALEIVRTELAGEVADSSAFMTRVRIATHSFSQDPSIPLRELNLTYEAAILGAEKYGYLERIKEEQAAMSEWFAKEASLKPERVLTTLGKVIDSPRGDLEQIRRRSAQLLAIGCLARRLSISGDRNPEWLFVAAKALEADSKSGQDFFEAYLQSDRLKKLRHRKEAQAELDRIRKSQASEL